jgi:elongation factor P hydroxylase
MVHNSQDLIHIFNTCFKTSEETLLVKGQDEPIYLPKATVEANFPYHATYHQVVFAHGFFASALHEIAHWCIAGEARRALMDYGYWYVPDGRDYAQQQEFERAEIKPQALEWIFSEAANFEFKVSLDNLGDVPIDRQGFEQKVAEQKAYYLAHGLPKRASIFARALTRHFAQHSYQ